MNQLQVLQFIRSLGFSGCLGAGLFGIFYSLFPSEISDKVSLVDILLIGALAGSGLYGLFSALLSDSVRYTSYFFKLVQLVIVRGAVGERRFKELVEALAIKTVFPETHISVEPAKESKSTKQSKTSGDKKLVGKKGTLIPLILPKPPDVSVSQEEHLSEQAKSETKEHSQETDSSYPRRIKYIDNGNGTFTETFDNGNGSFTERTDLRNGYLRERAVERVELEKDGPTLEDSNQGARAKKPESQKQ